MSKTLTFLSLFLVLVLDLYAVAAEDWNPPSVISRQEILEASEALLAIPDIPLKIQEDIFRIRVLEMDWDMGAMVYEPEDPARIPMGVRSCRTHFEKFFFGGKLNDLSHAFQYARDILKCRQGPQSSTSSGKPLSFD